MPVALTYPGVYVEEIASGVRTITGVATSIAAFVGWAPKGPTDRAGLVLSWSDYEREYGGLDPGSDLSYAVSQFFANGGQRAYVVRLVATADGATEKAATAKVTLNGLTVTARSPGAWANQYAVLVKPRADDQTRFRIQIANIKLDPKGGVVVESFENLSMAANDRRNVNAVLNAESALVLSSGSGTAPGATPGGDVPEASWLAGGKNGDVLVPDSTAFVGALGLATDSGLLFQLGRVDLFNLLCVPGLVDKPAIETLQAYCRKRRALMIVDAKQSQTAKGAFDLATGNDAQNAAFYFPWIVAPDPLQQNRPREFPPCGFVAGVYARTDTQRGVWKAPAGSEASLTGVIGVKTPLNDDENGLLNPRGINCIRTFPVYGTVIWGARTLHGDDERGSEWKYVPVRRTALFIEETLFRATKWVVFEPNDEPLWAQIRLNIGAFMHDLFRQGAFQGSSPKDAYFVKCDKETTTQSDINRGIVNIVVGFAPLKPAEFVVIKLQQIAGDIQT